jgi:hypothetical protein
MRERRSLTIFDFNEGEKLFVDGGFLHNNPTELALFEAHHLWPDKQIEW